MNTCPKCGGSMLGDGYTVVRHCEFAEVAEDVEADAPPVLCDFTEDASVETPSTWATDDPNS